MRSKHILGFDLNRKGQHGAPPPLPIRELIHASEGGVSSSMPESS